MNRRIYRENQSIIMVNILLTKKFGKSIMKRLSKGLDGLGRFLWYWAITLMLNIIYVVGLYGRWVMRLLRGIRSTKKHTQRR